MESLNKALPFAAEINIDNVDSDANSHILQPQSVSQVLPLKIVTPERTSQSTLHNADEHKQEKNPNVQNNLTENSESRTLSQHHEKLRSISVEDHEQFIQAYMPDLLCEVEETGLFSWKLSDWGNLAEKLRSPKFSCGAHEWRVLLFPRGNTAIGSDQHVSLYLECMNPNNSTNKHVCAQFALVMSNPNDPTNYCECHSHHRFTYDSPDWGFTRFRQHARLYHPVQDHDKPIIENGSTTITVLIRVVKDTTGVLWHDFVNYDSKEATGYIGLKNQGATGYLNAALHTLYFTPCLRKAIYQIPTEDEVPRESIALALQRLFYQLETSDRPVATDELTKSFGWKAVDSFVQHDVQEFNRVLQDKIESKLKGTGGEGSVRKFLAGRMKNYIQCTDVDFKSSSIDEFYDIQLNIKGTKNLRESFQNYLSTEILTGENKYHAEGFGLQDAEKGVSFLSFPPILHIQLKRFEYDIQEDHLVKISGRHEYPSDIDLEEFLGESADKSEPCVYRLHGVIVHCGSNYGGNYATLIKPNPESSWFKFDNDRVVRVTDREVFNDNFGGDSAGSCAYVLIYVRESSFKDIFVEAESPAFLKRMDEEDRTRAEQKRKERDTQHLYFNVKVITEESFREHQDFDIATLIYKVAQLSQLTEYRILKQELYSSFKTIVAQSMDLPVDRMRFWVMIQRQNRTIRPDEIIPDHEPALTMEAIKTATVQATVRSNPSEIRFFLDVYPDYSGDRYSTRTTSMSVGRDPLAIASASGKAETNTIMIFLKHFDTKKQQLYSVCRVYVQVEDFIHHSLTPTICERMKWPTDTALRFFEEIKPGLIESIGPNKTFGQAEIQNGDIICSQLELSETEAAEIEAQGLFSSAMSFYDNLHNRVRVYFKPKEKHFKLPVKTIINEPNSNKDARFELILNKRMDYETMKQRVVDHLGCDPLKLKFTVPATESDGSLEPEWVLEPTPNFTVSDIISPKHGSTPTLLYELSGQNLTYVPLSVHGSNSK